jgi:predicted metal-dependent TIM-barrel fold hydrolase
VLVSTPWRGRDRITRRALAVLREADLDPARVLVAGADARTVRPIRACGYLAAHLLLRARGRAAAWMRPSASWPRSARRRSCSARIARLAGGDLLALARVADRLAKAGLSEAVAKRVCGGNAVAFLGVDLGAVGARR